jgi:ceramide glucosyltransferase
VSLLKPLHDDDGQLYENLKSFCTQDYPTYEVILAVRDPADPAVAVAARLVREVRTPPVRLVLGARTVGANLKICNVLHAARHARHDTLVVADADIRVRPDYLAAVTAPLDDPEVGVTTCLYVAVSGDDLASQLGAIFINDCIGPALHRYYAPVDMKGMAG